MHRGTTGEQNLHYSAGTVNSLENLPCYNGVEDYVTPLGKSGPISSFQCVTSGGIGLFQESFSSRLRYQEAQTGDAIYFGLFLPGGARVRFESFYHVKPFVVCWQGNPRREYEYVVEKGTRQFIVEVPRSLVNARDWQLPLQPFMSFELGMVDLFVSRVQHFLDQAKQRRVKHVPAFENLAMELVELLCGDGVFQVSRPNYGKRTSSLHRRIVTEVDCLFHVDLDGINWTSKDLCRALDVPKRTLYDAFQGQLGIGPLELHRRMRLLHLRKLLLNADSERGVVTRLMGQAGFSHLGRTSVAYRNMFGESPTDTLFK